MNNSHIEKGRRLAEKMTVREMISQLKNSSKGIKRLSVPPYNWWNECLHGVARAGTATVFPQAIGMAATFSEELLFRTAEIISTEARAKFNDSQSKNDYGIYKGLTMWSPNINIFRDPRWGRGQETYGEDPYLTSLLGSAFIRGLQGDDPEYIKTAACAKHFAVHSGPEGERHSFNAEVSKKDLFETYLPAFKRAVTDAKVCGVMGAYNRTNGEACCASPVLIQKILRESWGFGGYFVSDCGALCDIVKHHRLTRNPIKGAAMAINAGCELECGCLYRFLPLSYKFGLVKKETIENAASRLLSVRSSLGMFDESCPYSSIGIEENASAEHEAFAVTVAEKGIVLLENNGILPLERNRHKILVTGYNAENDLAYLGNYFGEPTSFIKVTEAVKAFNSSTEYAAGYSYKKSENEALQAEATEKAKNADIILICTGIDSSIEGEESDAKSEIVGSGGDRATLDLPKVQKELLDRLIPLGRKIIILNFSGSCINFGKYRAQADAIVQCWYPGAKGGKAIANILFGDVSPSGKLPVTFYSSVGELPDFRDYSMKNRTYRYFDGTPQYPFGYGLSYTDFELTKLEKSENKIYCAVKNTGGFPSDEVLQLYISLPKTDYENPRRSLIRTKRLHLAQGEERELVFSLKESDFYSVNGNGDTVLLSGEYKIFVSDGQSIVSDPLVFINEKETEIKEKCPI